MSHFLDNPIELIRHDVVDPFKARWIEFTTWPVRHLQYYQFNQLNREDIGDGWINGLGLVNESRQGFYRHRLGSS